MSAVTAIEPFVELNSLETSAAPLPKRRKPRVWTVFTTWILASIVGTIGVFAGYVGIGLVTGAVMGAQGADAATIQAGVQEITAMPLPTLLVTLLPFQAGMLVVVLLAGWLSKEPLKERLGLLPQTGRSFGGIKLASMAGFTLAAAFALNIASNLVLGPPPMDDPLSAALVDASFWTITLLSVVLSVVPATVEELLFRGYMQRRMLQRWSPGVAVTVSSLLFAVMHMDSLQHIIAVIPLGVVTGLLAYKTNSVKPGMIVHGAHNVAAVVLPAAFTAASAYYSNEVLGLIFLGSIPVFGLIGLPAVISLLRNPKQPQVAAYIVPEETVESPSVLKRELALPDYVTESRVTTQAV